MDKRPKLKWIKKWKVPSFSDPEKNYTVSLALDGVTWGCSCWPWRKTRKDCKHIPVIKNNPTAPDEEITYNLVTVIPDKYVNKPIYDEKEKLIYVPLIPLNPYDVHMEATICYFLLQQGFTITNIREIRSLSPSWTKKSIINIIKEKGMKEYALVNLEEFSRKGIPKSTLERFKTLELDDQ